MTPPIPRNIFFFFFVLVDMGTPLLQTIVINIFSYA
jgi:hypothetical protein